MEFTGKSVKDAIKEGLNVLGITEENAEIVVVKEAVKGLFGKVKENAVVEIKEKKVEAKKSDVKEEPKKAKTKIKIDGDSVVDFTEKLLKLLDIDAKAKFSEGGENPVVNIECESSSKLIGFRGEVLDSIQTLVSAKANIGNSDYQKVVVDCENYRNKREETLISLAKKLEQKATELRREVILEPMNPFERRIIHTALANSATVTTRSDGKEPNRYVVIVPNDLEENSRPYNAGRKNNDKHGGKYNNRKPNNRRNKPKGHTNNFGEQKKTTSISFGTFLGNSLKDKK